MDRLEVFQNELALIAEPEIRELTEFALKSAEAKFFVAPASSSGKYHTVDSRTVGTMEGLNNIIVPGGLVHHTKDVVKLAHEGIPKLFCADDLMIAEKSAIICASILHDITKYGIPCRIHTIAEHGELAARWLEKIAEDKLSALGEHWSTVPNIIIEGIALHMGRWAPSKNKPTLETTGLIHEADYWASRKFIKIER
ncbi:MAG: HD domain-containing protein [Candidatus Izemoplasmatales bacterium]|jgi:hypothetical protein